MKVTNITFYTDSNFRVTYECGRCGNTKEFLGTHYGETFPLNAIPKIICDNYGNTVDFINVNYNNEI